MKILFLLLCAAAVSFGQEVGYESVSEFPTPELTWKCLKCRLNDPINGHITCREVCKAKPAPGPVKYSAAIDHFTAGVQQGVVSVDDAITLATIASIPFNPFLLYQNTVGTLADNTTVTTDNNGVPKKYRLSTFGPVYTAPANAKCIRADQNHNCTYATNATLDLYTGFYLANGTGIDGSTVGTNNVAGCYVNNDANNGGIMCYGPINQYTSGQIIDWYGVSGDIKSCGLDNQGNLNCNGQWSSWQ